MQIMRSRAQDYLGQHGETPSLLKIQKLAEHDGRCLESQLPERLRQDNCFKPGAEIPPLHSSLVTEEDFVSKKKRKMKFWYMLQHG